jgi:hypothetical protein
MTESINVKFGPCCFCGEDIEESDIDPCRVMVTPKHGMWQVWSSHAECFKQGLAEFPKAPGLFDPAHF